MKTNAELIVLRCTKFGEKNLSLHTISKEYGRRSFMVKVGKGLSMAMFFPLNVLEADIIENPKSSFWSAKNFQCRFPLTGIRNNLYKNAITLFISEVLYRTLKDGTNEEGLFDWCVKMIITLDAIDTDFSNYHIRFLLEFAGALGFCPTFEDIAPFCSSNSEKIRLFLTKDFSESMLIPLGGEERTEICEDLIRYLEFHTESTIKIQSLKVLRDIFAIIK